MNEQEQKERIQERLRMLERRWVLATNALLMLHYDLNLHTELVKTLENPIR
jgi:hypothetical protein